MKNRTRIFESKPIDNAVATQDTVTPLRAFIRRLLIALAGLTLTDLAAKVGGSPARNDAIPVNSTAVTSKCPVSQAKDEPAPRCCTKLT